jgi:hypothetical protein
MNMNIIHPMDPGTDHGSSYDRKRGCDRRADRFLPNATKPRNAIVNSAVKNDLAAAGVDFDVDFDFDFDFDFDHPLYLLDQTTDEVTTLVAQQTKDDTDFIYVEPVPQHEIFYGSLVSGTELGFAQCALKRRGHQADADEDYLDDDAYDRPMDGFGVRRTGW